jgi:hypothetical protein
MNSLIVVCLVVLAVTVGAITVLMRRRRARSSRPRS